MHEVEENGANKFISFQDDQIQQRLLEADDEICAKEILNNQMRTSQRQKSSVGNSNGNAVSSTVTDNSGNKSNNARLQKLLKEFRTAPLCGWFIDSNVVYRKTENEAPSKSKGTTGSVSKDFSRDSRNKPRPPPDFIFRHYIDTRHYIEQYRHKHACSDAVSLSATRNGYSDLQRLNPCNQYSPLAACSQINTFQQNATLPSSQQEGLFSQNTEQQYQPQHKPQWIPTVQHSDKQEPQRQTFHSDLQSSKQLHSPYGTHDVSRIVNGPESFHSKSRSERAGSAKELVFTPSACDTSVHKSEVTMRKLHTSNNVGLIKYTKLPKPESPLELSAGAQVMGHKLGCGLGNQPRLFDTFACSVGNRTETQSSGVQETVNNSETGLESHCVVNKWHSNTKPSQLVMTHKGGWPQTLCRPDLSETLHLSQRLHIRESDTGISSIEKGDSASSVPHDTAEKPTPGADKMSEQKLPRKERPVLAVTGHDCCKTRKFVYDRWAVAKRQDEKSLLSHNRRIRHLIEQSKLKCKFGQTLNLSKRPSGRSILEINSIQISDPFAKAVPRSDQNSNNNNCDLDFYNGLSSCFTDIKISNNSIKGKGQGACFRINPNQIEIPASCGGMGEFNYFTSDGGFTDTSVKKDCYDRGCDKSVVNKAGLTDHNLFRHSQPGRDDMKTACGQDFPEIAGDSSCKDLLANHLPRKGKPMQTSKDKCYIQKLAEEVSAMVKFTVPKFRCSKFPLVYRSQSMDL